MAIVHVYRAALDALSEASCLPLLDEAEYRRASRVSNPDAKSEFIKTRALLRFLLARHTGRAAHAIELGTGVNGKPSLVGRPDPHFNVSHSGGMAIVAIASTQIGIDIERINPQVDYWSIAEAVFGHAELEMLREAEQTRRREVFFSVWTKKEAYLKATGRGFSAELPAISVACSNGSIEDEAEGPGGRTWHAFELAAPPGYKAALVASDRNCGIRISDVTCLSPAVGPQPAGGQTGRVRMVQPTFSAAGPG